MNRLNPQTEPAPPPERHRAVENAPAAWGNSADPGECQQRSAEL